MIKRDLRYGMIYLFIFCCKAKIRTVAVVAVVHSHNIQRNVLATEETTVAQGVSHRPIKGQSRSLLPGYTSSTGPIMVTSPYSNQ